MKPYLPLQQASRLTFLFCFHFLCFIFYFLSWVQKYLLPFFFQRTGRLWYRRFPIHMPIPGGLVGACGGVTTASSIISRGPHSDVCGDSGNVLPWQEHISLWLQNLDKLLTSLKVSRSSQQTGCQNASRYPLPAPCWGRPPSLALTEFPLSFANSLYDTRLRCVLMGYFQERYPNRV